MILTEKEKAAIANMEVGQLPIELDDEKRSNYQYKVERPSCDEYRIAKFAIICLAVEYFNDPGELINYIK